MTNLPNIPPGDPINYQSLGSTEKDAEHLKVLSICWWILAGFGCLGFCGGVAVIAVSIFLAASGRAPDPSDMPTWLIGTIGVFYAVIAFTMALLCYLVGKSLKQRRRIILCYIMAGFICLSFPLGTTLGIFTFIVLARPQVKGSFH